MAARGKTQALVLAWVDSTRRERSHRNARNCRARAALLSAWSAGCTGSPGAAQGVICRYRSNHPCMVVIFDIQWLGRTRIPWGSPGTRTSTVGTPRSLSAL